MCFFRILQESLVALKTILKEIDSYAFEESLKLDTEAKKRFQIRQGEDDRKRLDQKWEKLNNGLKSTNTAYEEPQIPFTSDGLIMDFNELYRKIYDKEKFVNQ